MNQIMNQLYRSGSFTVAESTVAWFSNDGSVRTLGREFCKTIHQRGRVLFRNALTLTS